MGYVGRSDSERAQMLESLGVKHLEDLLPDVPSEVLFQGDLGVGEPLSEIELRRELSRLAAKNPASASVPSFLGGGSYDHYVPAALPRLVFRSEFMTAYTPYQPEVAQGTLTAIFEFQSMIAELTGLDVANASLYDGASAVAEACHLARGHSRRQKIVLAGGLHPNAIEVTQTIVGEDVQVLPAVNGRLDPGATIAALDETVAAVVLPYPNFFGIIDDGIPAVVEKAKEHGVLVIASADPVALAALTPPGEWGADICVGEAQSLGVPSSFGGPVVGYLAAKQALVRRLPGRIAGETVDMEGRRGYVLTLQTREQHIRREKATSNICTNQGLFALAATVYLALVGKEGLREVADHCFQKTHSALDRIQQKTGLQAAYDAPFFREFVLELPVPASEVCRIGLERGMLVGIDLGRFDPAWANHLLVSATEKRTKQEIDAWAEIIAVGIGSQNNETAEVTAR